MAEGRLEWGWFGSRKIGVLGVKRIVRALYFVGVVWIDLRVAFVLKYFDLLLSKADALQSNPNFHS